MRVPPSSPHLIWITSQKPISTNLHIGGYGFNIEFLKDTNIQSTTVSVEKTNNMIEKWPKDVFA